MTSVYLIRHGQAGTRNRYDTLSELGRLQACRLGETLAAHPVEFTSVLCGALARQQETAAAVREAYERAGRDFPAVVTDAEWNEFDLDAVYRDLAPQLAARDPQFRAGYEEMQAQMADDAHDIHRRWSDCDLALIRAWVGGKLPVETETWVVFQERIARAWNRLAGARGETAAVFTSATPIAIAAGIVLEVGTRTRFRLTGALYNSAWTVLRIQGGEASLFSFNNIPHLNDPSLRTFR